MNDQVFFRETEISPILKTKQNKIMTLSSIENTQAFLDNPKFWLKKCSEKNLSKDLRILWTNLIKKIENTSLEQNVNSCLVKMHRDAPYSYQVSFFLLEKKVYYSQFMKNILTKGIKNFFQSPLYMASEKGDLKLVQFILDQELESSWGQNNHQNGKTPIHIAAMNGHSEVVKVLAVNDTDVQLADILQGINVNGWTPIQLAAMNGCTEVVKVLASLSKEPNSPQYGGWTPLQLAAENGHTKVVKILAAQCKIPNAPGHGGWTPIQLAAENGHTDVVKVLINFTENPNAPGISDGRSPLRLAVSNGHSEVVKILLACKDVLNTIDFTQTISPLHTTTSSSSLQHLKRIREIDFTENNHSDAVKLALVTGSPQTMLPVSYRQNFAAKRRSYTPMVRRRNALAPMNSDFSVSPEKSKISFKTTTSQLTFDPHSPPCTIGLTKIRIHKIPIKSEKSTSSSSERSSPTNNNNHVGGGQYTPYSSNLYSVSKRSRQYASCRSAA